MDREFILFVLLFLVAGCEKLDNPQPVIVGMVDRNRIELIAESNDLIISLPAREGATVMAGDIILEQDKALYLARLQQVKAARERLSFRLAELVRGPRIEQINSARAKLQGLEKQIVIQRREYERILKLVQQDLSTASALDAAQATIDISEAQIEQARADLDALLNGTTDEELAQAEAGLDEANAAVSTQQILLERLTIRSPVDGIIDELPYNIGDKPIPGSSVAVILQSGLPYARVYIPEPVRSQIHPGLDAEIRVDGISRAFRGKVRYVSADAAFTPYFALTLHDRSRLNFLAEVDFIEQEANDIPSGVPLEISFPSINLTSE